MNIQTRADPYELPARTSPMDDNTKPPAGSIPAGGRGSEEASANPIQRWPVVREKAENLLSAFLRRCVRVPLIRIFTGEARFQIEKCAFGA